MSNKTVSQREAELMDRIEKTKEKLGSLQQRHKLEIGHLAYKHGLQHLSLKELELVFAKLASEVNHAF